jgi:SAM-dependent methyltransferase
VTGPVSPRILAAVALLAPRPGERLLEIGCGTGQAIQAVTACQPSATIVAIDRSDTAVGRARIVNAAAIAAGRVSVSKGEVEHGPVAPGGFDRIFAIRVNSFWTRPGLALPHVVRSLRPGSEIWILYDGPTDRIVETIRSSLAAFGFQAVRTEAVPGRWRSSGRSQARRARAVRRGFDLGSGETDQPSDPAIGLLEDSEVGDLDRVPELRVIALGAMNDVGIIEDDPDVALMAVAVREDDHGALPALALLQDPGARANVGPDGRGLEPAVVELDIEMLGHLAAEPEAPGNKTGAIALHAGGRGGRAGVHAALAQLVANPLADGGMRAAQYGVQHHDMSPGKMSF